MRMNGSSDDVPAEREAPADDPSNPPRLRPGFVILTEPGDPPRLPVRTAIERVLAARHGPLLEQDQKAIIAALNRRAAELIDHLQRERTADYIALLLEARDARGSEEREETTHYVAEHMLAKLQVQ